MTRSGTVLRLRGINPLLHEEVGRRYDAVDLPSDAQERSAFLAEHGADVVAVVCATSGRVDRDLIAALPRLGVIANQGVGYENVDVDAALERGVAVSHTPDVLDAAVAEAAVGLLIAARRHLVAADRFVRDGGWEKGPYPLTGQVSGSHVGILGLGRIGDAIASRLVAFGCRISYHNRRPVPGSPYAYVDDLAALAAAVDALVVVVPGGDGTRQLVDRDVLDALGPDGVLVNMARGSVVDEDALVSALADGRLGGAALDVFAREPHVPAELLTMDQVVLAPHVGSATHVTRAAMRDLVLDNLTAWMEGRELVSPIPEMRLR